MAHGDPVANSDRRKFERHSAGLPNTGFYRISDLPQMHMPRNQFIERIDHADQRFRQILFRDSQRVEQ